MGLGKIILLLLTPFKWLGRLIWLIILRPLYRLYRLFKSKLNKIIAPTKNRWAYFIFHRNTVTALVAIVAMLIAFNNVQAQSSDPATFGRKSIFANIFPGDPSEDLEIIEGPATQINKEQKLALTPTLNIAARPVADSTSENNPEQQLALGSGGTSEDSSEEVRYYIVEGGDTISSIAQQFSISTETILWANNLSEADYIKPGQKLTILPIDGVIHTIKSGETIKKIATKYKADSEKILAFNRLASGEALNAGEELIIPGGSIEPAVQPIQPSTSATRKFAIFNIPAPARVVPGARLQWPTISRRINQYYKYRHTGVDIDGDYSSPIYAADSGVVESVIYARYGYGFHIIINHGAGRETLYGHASKIFVRAGQSVKRGQTIGMVGSTGRSTGTHLHFEVMQNGGKRNPLSYL
jgi:murein DD-endopeptidase MepM/ murein hydrolase activator NlpD